MSHCYSSTGLVRSHCCRWQFPTGLLFSFYAADRLQIHPTQFIDLCASIRKQPTMSFTSAIIRAHVIFRFRSQCPETITARATISQFICYCPAVMRAHVIFQFWCYHPVTFRASAIFTISLLPSGCSWSGSYFSPFLC
jgi:hypothetical protein